VVSLCRCCVVPLCRCCVVSLCRCCVVYLCRCCVVSLCRCCVVSLCRCCVVSLCRCCVVSFPVVYFILFVTVAFILFGDRVWDWEEDKWSAFLKSAGIVGWGFWWIYGLWGFNRDSKILLGIWCIQHAISPKQWTIARRTKTAMHKSYSDTANRLEQRTTHNPELTKGHV